MLIFYRKGEGNVTIEFSITPDLIKLFCPSYAVWLLWQFDRLEPM
jgi:hypothetical protein